MPFGFRVWCGRTLFIPQGQTPSPLLRLQSTIREANRLEVSIAEERIAAIVVPDEHVHRDPDPTEVGHALAPPLHDRGNVMP